ncbi:hypothetical protein E2320_015842 [Naja naja]|nr:hypothetical protein E2320_015842 [Naja naja]
MATLCFLNSNAVCRSQQKQPSLYRTKGIYRSRRGWDNGLAIDQQTAKTFHSLLPTTSRRIYLSCQICLGIHTKQLLTCFPGSSQIQWGVR